MVVLCLFIVISLPWVSSADLLENTSSVTVKAPAVSAGPEPEGAVIEITVYVTEGKGRVFVNTEPFTQIDMQGSARLAAIVATDLLGIDFNRFDYFYVIKAETPVVGGPSAGGVMTVATVAAIEGWTINGSVMMTGMILPDGSIGPVGGIPYKLEAAKLEGVKLFLVPAGQTLVIREKRETVERGPFIFVRTVKEPIDLVKYGEEMGITVKEVSDLNEAVKYYTGYAVKQLMGGNISSQTYTEISRTMADAMKKDTNRLFEQAKKYGSLTGIEDLLKVAQEEYDSGNYYSATSTMLTARIQMRQIIYSNTLIDEKAIKDEMTYIDKEINDLKEDLKNESILNLQAFQLIGTAETRLYMAENYLQQAKEAESFSQAITYLALARERLETAKIWLTPYHEGVIRSSGMVISENKLRDRANFYISQALSLETYASSIGGHQELLSMADSSIELARSMFADGLYAGAVLSAVDGIVDASVSIEVIGISQNQLNEKVEKARISAENSISRLKDISEPIIPLTDYEFARTSKDPLIKLIFYRSADQTAKVLTFMSKSQPQIMTETEKAVNNESGVPAETPVPQENPELPGFTLSYSILSIIVTLFIIAHYRRR